ncbi:hypothetical protein F5B22DRAFT_650097 [Xylaria bambusicola]|uniref:uncharacterized protein n=1 Tax=Xylaria bambusicola TaxID=326684 RepID=UPI0020081D61|nr:uncharacterized protein F5B22DRAFT_650097 [Xylaria bambusicola]KAI0508243.1 hypothetical protein F5B22DRAFT_650097 [Xylaria bambusicola]
MAPCDLGQLTGNSGFHQYTNSAGQVYYLDMATNAICYSILSGFGDNPNDTWTRDSSKSWPQGNNDRTGRAVLMDPNPPPPQSYLDNDNVKAGLELLTRVPDSKEHLYRRSMGSILRFMFPEREGFDVVQETEGDNSRPDFSTLKVSQRPGGTLYQYDFMLTESKKMGQPWGATEDQLQDHLAGNGNESKNCYGRIQIGLLAQFYKYEGGICSKVGG